MAFGRRLGQRGDDAAAQAVEEILIRQNLRATRVAVLRIDEHEIDVGRDVELAAAELAHGDDDQLFRRGAVDT